jgi:hypothetical protein
LNSRKTYSKSIDILVNEVIKPWPPIVRESTMHEV